MKDNLISLLRTAHFILIIFAISFSIQMWFLRDIYQASWTVMYSLPLLLLVSDLLYKLSKRLWIYIILQIILFTAFIAFSGDYKLGYIVAFVLCVFCQVEDKKYQHFILMDPAWGFAILLGLLYFMGYATKRPLISEMAIPALMIYILITLIFLNLTGMRDFMQVRKNVQNVSFVQMNRANTVFMSYIVGMLLLVFVAGSIFMDNSPLLWLLSFLGEGFVKVARHLFSKLELAEDSGDYDPILDDFSAGSEGGSRVILDMSWLDFIVYVIGIALTIVIVYFTVRALVALVKRLMKGFRNNHETVEEDEYILNEITDISHIRVKAEKLNPKQETDRVRIKYKKAILAARVRTKKPAPDSSYTPSELEADSFNNDISEEMAALHAEYEKARYGQRKE